MDRNFGEYGFRQVVAEDLPLLREWLRSPEVVRWWGEPEEQERLLEEDLSEPQMVMLLVSYQGRPFAYAQHYDVHAWPQAHLAGLPAGSRAIDTFIGVQKMVGCGHGAAFLRLLAEELRQGGAPVVAIDPRVENVRARRAFARAGFEGEKVVETGEGSSVLMVFV